MRNEQATIRVLHVVDAGLTWDERLGLEHLLDRLPEDRFEQVVVSLGPVVGEARRLAGQPRVIPIRFDLNCLMAPALRRMARERGGAVVHAWGPRAVGVVCAGGAGEAQAALSLYDPSRAADYANLIRAAGGRRSPAVLCATEIVRRRLVERGVAADRAGLVRPGVDFSAINRAKKSDRRARLGVPPTGLLLVTDQPATRAGGQFAGVWAGAVRAFLDSDVRVVVAGESREAHRLSRLARAVHMPELVIRVGEAVRQEELIAVADVLLAPSAEETSVTAIAWAMAAGVSVVASATRATAELLAHQHNAFLIKPDVTKRLALRFAAALEQRRDWGKLRETARGQAFEVFSMRRYADQTAQVYENLRDGRTVSEGVTDPAAA